MKTALPESEAGGSNGSAEGPKLQGFVWKPEADQVVQNPYFLPTIS